MAIGDRTYPFQRHSFGDSGQFDNKGIVAVSFGYTKTHKDVANASATAVHASIASTTSAQTVTTSITDPDAPRALSVTPGGTTADIRDNAIVITGVNVEGKTITDTFKVEKSSSTIVNGNKAFKRVTSIAIPPMDGTGATFTVGTLNQMGMNHRLYPNNTTIKVVSDTGTTQTLQAAPTINRTDTAVVENNLITPATAPDGTTFLKFYYIFDQWTLAPINDEPVYSTSTSTSTSSTSTSSTTVTTSTSSTSSSTSSTSSSTSSTSTSTSSTSTSTTTVP